MRQLEALRHRASGNERWFRLGLISTTAIAPLIARWNDLRATKRDLRRHEERESRFAVLREQAQSRMEPLRTLVARGKKDLVAQPMEPVSALLLSMDGRDGARPRPRPRSDNVRVGLWLAGVGVGLAATGVGAYFLVRRRLASHAEEPMLELPIEQAPRGQGPAGGTMSGQDKPTARTRAGATTEPQDRQSAPRTPGDAREAAPAEQPPAEVAELGLPFSEAAGVSPVVPSSGAAFVGNIHTMIYHAASDSAHLPAEENRVYFASAEEAEEAGYRRDRRTKPPTSEAGITSAEGPMA